ncbi:MAG: aldehyde ferredoxin oxidoreductase family protein [Promethearchaeota archaeon]|jgi:aldehyde:ferredoxin oxidoreductase
MSNFSGMTGKLLRLNLTTGESKVDNIQSDLWEHFIGGRGLGAYYLTKEVPSSVEPLSADNKLIFMNGPLASTLIPGNNKICVTFKSPLTNTYSYSLCGGHWGPELKFAGYDGLIIEGRAENPVYISIKNEKVEIRPAEKIWGRLIPESDKLIREEFREDDSIQIALIGPAGEKLVKYACITAGLYREFGRGGAGAVMGSKNLKGIVLSSSKDVIVANPEKVFQLGKELIRDLRNSRGGKVRREFGTMELVERINNAGFWITRNFTEGHFEEGYKLEGRQMRDEIIVGDSSCYGCPVGCGKRTYIKAKSGEEFLMEGPEFETVGMLGSNCGISSWETLLKASKICDTYGFDTINAGACVSMVMEAFESGRLTLEDTDGIKLLFGNDNALLHTLIKIGKREGLGDILAKGPVEASRILNIEELAMHSKGQSFPVYDPRGAKGMALTYATSPKGAHHMLATTFGAELSSGTRFQVEGKGSLERDHQFSMAIVDSIAVCSTMRAGIPLDNLLKAYSTVTGIKHDIESFLKAAERIINLERMYNVNLGLDRRHDTLPKRFLEETLPSGESKGQIVELDAVLDDYYNVMGWTSNGIPTEAKLLDLSLKDFIK